MPVHLALGIREWLEEVGGPGGRGKYTLYPSQCIPGPSTRRGLNSLKGSITLTWQEGDEKTQKNFIIQKWVSVVNIYNFMMCLTSVPKKGPIKGLIHVLSPLFRTYLYPFKWLQLINIGFKGCFKMVSLKKECLKRDLKRGPIKKYALKRCLKSVLCLFLCLYEEDMLQRKQF